MPATGAAEAFTEAGDIMVGVDIMDAELRLAGSLVAAGESAGGALDL
jgi:hypothetical protein